MANITFLSQLISVTDGTSDENRTGARLYDEADLSQLRVDVASFFTQIFLPTICKTSSAVLFIHFTVGPKSNISHIEYHPVNVKCWKESIVLHDSKVLIRSIVLRYLRPM